MNCNVAFAVVAATLVAGAAHAQDEKPAAPPPATEEATATPHPLEGLWELRMERTVWWPHVVPGSLAVSRGPQGLRASVTFDSMWGIDPTHVTVEPAVGDQVRFSVDMTPDDRVRVEGRVTDGVFVGQSHWKADPPDTCFLSASRLAPMRRFEPDTSSDPFPLEADPARVGIDPVALDRLIHYAGRCDTDALFVVKDGRVVCDRTFLRPRGLCTTQSITKAVASLAIPLLVEEGKLPRDFDTPLSTWYPDWKTDPRKSRITLRHVLTHTSGLASDGTREMQGKSDYLAYARESAAVHEPGTRWAYSNQALELLAGIVSMSAGEQVDTYLGQRVFRPLGISNWRWSRDGAGTVPTYAGLDLAARDLARIGSMVCARGRLKDKQLVPEWWFDEIAAPGAVNEEVGLVWWLLRDKRDEKVVQTRERLDRLVADGCADAARLAPLVGKTFESRRAWWVAAMKLLGKDESVLKSLRAHLPHPAVGGELIGPISCVYHTGSMGQYLLVFPEQHLVVVRQRRGFAQNELPKDVSDRAGFGDLPKLAQDLLW